MPARSCARVPVTSHLDVPNPQFLRASKAEATRYDDRVSRWIAFGMAAVAAAWLLLLIAAPLLSTPLAAALYAAGSLICHQLPDRSFHVQGSQLPVCARCFGLYAGSAVGTVAAAVAFARSPLPRQSSGLQRRWVLWLVTISAAAPTLATFAAEWGMGWPVSNVVRTVAALPLGCVVAFVVVRAAATLHYD